MGAKKPWTKQFVKDIIKDEHKEWNVGDCVFIRTPTDTGKSTFVFEELSTYADECNQDILFLCNRSKLQDQVNDKIEESNSFNIKSMTYQKLESNLKQNKFIDELCNPKLKYIVCDEAHYFTTDIKFNHWTDISLHHILKQSQCVLIFMSATGSVLFDYIKSKIRTRKFKENNKIYNYPTKISKNNHDQIKRLLLYREEDSLEQTIDLHYNKGEKIIHFCNSKEKALKLFQKYGEENATFLCSKSDKKYSKYCNWDNIIKVDGNTTFKTRFLFTTTVLDNGFNLEDENIKLVICDEFNMTTMLQCVGRKRRLSENDKFDLILYNHNNHYFNAQISKLKDALNEIKLFGDGSRDNFNNWNLNAGRYFKNSNDVVYSDGDKFKVSQLKKFVIEEEYKMLNGIREDNRQNNIRREIDGYESNTAYSDHVHILLSKVRTKTLEKIYKVRDLDDYLKSILNVPILTVKDRQPIIRKLNVRSTNGRIIKSLNGLNASLEAEGSKYMIIECISHKEVNGKRKIYSNSWKIVDRILYLDDVD